MIQKIREGLLSPLPCNTVTEAHTMQKLRHTAEKPCTFCDLYVLPYFIIILSKTILNHG